MLKMTHRLPHDTIKLAFSGGVDSLAIANFWKRKSNVVLMHFNHGCEYSDEIEAQARDRAALLNMPIIVGHLTEEKPSNQSLEEFWRIQRYRFLYGGEGNHVVTGHHLDDAIETWLWSSMHGEGKIISPKADYTHNGKTNTLHRPFLLTPKRNIEEYAHRHGLMPVDDPFNRSDKSMRNYIRNTMMPHVLHVNPGIEKTIRKKYLEMKA